MFKFEGIFVDHRYLYFIIILLSLFTKNDGVWDYDTWSVDLILILSMYHNMGQSIQEWNK